MYTKTKILVSVLSLVGVAGCVQGEINSPDSFKTGFYIGGAVGAGQMSSSRFDRYVEYKANSDEPRDGFPDDHSSNVKRSFFQGGVSAGFLYRIEDTNWVLGVEPYFQGRTLKSGYGWTRTKEVVVTDVVWDDEEGRLEPDTHLLSQDEKHYARVKFPWAWGVNLRVGYVLPQDYLLYGLIGFSRNRVQFEKWVDSGVVVPTISQDGTVTNRASSMHGEPRREANKRQHFWGINYGLGLEKQLKFMRVGVEFTYSHWRKFCIDNDDRHEDNELVSFRPKHVWGVMLRFSIPF